MAKIEESIDVRSPRSAIGASARSDLELVETAAGHPAGWRGEVKRADEA